MRSGYSPYAATPPQWPRARCGESGDKPALTECKRRVYTAGMTPRSCSAAPPVRVPDAPILVARLRGAVWRSRTGEAETLSGEAVAARLKDGQVPMVCHARATARRLGLAPFPAYDVLELFAFVRPARFCLPTTRGLAAALLLTPPGRPEEEAEAIPACARALLAELRAAPHEDTAAIAWAMARGGWLWGPAVMGALAVPDDPARTDLSGGLHIWPRLREWQETAPPPPPEAWPVEAVEARARLVQLLGPNAEPRPQQMTYAGHAAAAFAPRARAGEPAVVVAEAGTGIGKTLGYVAPATVWAGKNKGTVWISTYTRNLQRQLDQELDRPYPDLAEKTQRVVVRKGRENIFCLLNYEEAVARTPPRDAPAAIALGLVARWALATRDGDMVGGDFPGWLADLLGAALTTDLTDTRGECVYTACAHYRRCFIERQVRKARRAQIVVANHALVMTQAALGGDDAHLPTRYVFDEGHHLFDAADSAFSACLSGRETAELRRWLLGPEERGRARGRGLRQRVAELIADDAAANAALDRVVTATRCLPGPAWRRRLAAGETVGPAEAFLALVREQVYARDPDVRAGYSLECDLRPPVPGLVEAGAALGTALAKLAEPLTSLGKALADLLDAKADELDPATRQRADGVLRGLDRRAIRPLAAWRDMLASLSTETPDAFVDWLGVTRVEGGDVDMGLHRHWRDPMVPFIGTVVATAHGALITSATLRDGTGNDDADWAAAQARTGTRHLAAPPILSALDSPFDYAARTRVLVVTDVGRDDAAQVAAAYRTLFQAAGGGALGLFTAIHRLRAVYARIAGPLEEAGLPLLAQHMDVLDTGTLIDVFRSEENACLLGTDAVRDGIDVPGRSLRLIVFDRVPWPRPTILHRARRDTFGGRTYDELLTRLKLAQAFGRLIRRADDRGVFVMLDRALPSRLLGAFPPGVAVVRTGLAACAAEIRAFLAQP